MTQYVLRRLLLLLPVLLGVTLFAHGMLLLTGDPSRIIEELSGKIWQKAIDKRELGAYLTELQVISTRLVAGRTVIHVYAPDRPAILAIIDWELSTLGDPLADFAYLAMNWAMPHGGRGAQLGGLDLPALGIPTLEEMTGTSQAMASSAERPKLSD